MAVSIQRPQVFNPSNRTKRNAKNPGYLAMLGNLNPQTKSKGKHMPKKKAAKASASKRSSKKPMPKSRNPFFKKPAPRRSPRRASNPDKIRPVEMLKEGAVVLAGLITARQLPQLVLGTKNTGPMGYAANVGVAIAGGLALGMAVSPRVGFAFAAGGAAYSISRVATENLSPVGKYFSLSGVGDAAAASLGDVRRAGMGIVVDSSYNEPMLKTANGTILIPPHIQNYVAREMQSFAPQPMPATVGRFRR